MVQSGDMDLGKVLQDVQSIVKTVPQALTDCGLADRRFGPLFDNSTCEQSMDTVAKDVPAIVKDIESENWEQLLTDANQLYQDVLGVVNACEGTAPETIFDDLVHAVLSEVTLPSGADAAKCETDIDGMWPDIVQLIKDVEAGDENKILVDALKIYSAIESSMKDCLGKTEIRFNDMSSCIADLTDVAAKAKDIYSMVQSGDIDLGTVIADVQAIASDIQKAQTDCSMHLHDEEPVMRELAAEEIKMTCLPLKKCMVGCNLEKPAFVCGPKMNKLKCARFKRIKAQ